MDVAERVLGLPEGVREFVGAGGALEAAPLGRSSPGTDSAGPQSAAAAVILFSSHPHELLLSSF